MRGGKHSSWLQLALGIVVSVGALTWAMSDLIFDDNRRAEMISAFTQGNYLMLIPFWGLLVGFYWLKAWRWQTLLAPVGRFAVGRDLVPPMLIGFAFNNLLPAHLGEFVRVFAFSHSHKVPRVTVLSTLVLERVFDVMAVLVYFGIGVAFIPELDPRIHQAAIVLGVGAGCVIVGGIAYVVWTGPMLRLVERVLSRLPFVPASVRLKIGGVLEAGAQGLAALKSGPALLTISANSLVQWGLNGGLAYVALLAYGVQVPPAAVCLLLAVIAFGVTVPSTPGYVGVVQACFMAVLTQFSQEGDKANIFAASIFYHLGQYIPVTLFGLLCLRVSGLQMRQVNQAVTHEEATSAPVTAPQVDAPVKLEAPT